MSLTLVHLKQIVFILILCVLGLKANAQFGIRVNYNFNNAPSWNNFFSELDDRNTKVLSTSLSFSIDYWLRLPNHRIEFYPYISFHQSNSRVWEPVGGFGNNFDVGLRQIGGGVVAHVYIFDLIGDCECPTFSKQGTFLKKGFFLLAGIGGDHSQKAIDGNYVDGNVDFKASLGAGLDIGINDLITISPIIQYQYYPAISWHDLGVPFGLESSNARTSFGQIQFGIRVGFRPDYK